MQLVTYLALVPAEQITLYKLRDCRHAFEDVNAVFCRLPQSSADAGQCLMSLVRWTAYKSFSHLHLAFSWVVWPALALVFLFRRVSSFRAVRLSRTWGWKTRGGGFLGSLQPAEGGPSVLESFKPKEPSTEGHIPGARSVCACSLCCVSLFVRSLCPSTY